MNEERKQGRKQGRKALTQLSWGLGLYIHHLSNTLKNATEFGLWHAFWCAHLLRICVGCGWIALTDQRCRGGEVRTAKHLCRERNNERQRHKQHLRMVFFMSDCHWLDTRSGVCYRILF